MVGVFEIEALNEWLCAIASRALGENGDLRVKIVARLEVGLRLALLVDALIVGANADHSVAEAIVVK